MPGNFLNDELTALWAHVDSATAFAAGYPVDPSWAGPRSEQERCALAQAIDRAIEACPAGDELARAALLSLRAQADIAPLHLQSREAVEWLRALIYRDLLGTDLARAVEEALERRIAALEDAYGGAPPLQKLLCAIDLQALAKLAHSTRSWDLKAKVARLLVRVDGSSVEANLEVVRKVLRDSREVAVVTPQQHQVLLGDAFCFEETVEEIETLASRWLAEELEITRPLARRVGLHLGLANEYLGDLETIFSEFSRQRQPQARKILDEAKRQTRIALPLFQEHLVELTPAQRAILPEPTPEAMTPLVTEGEEYMVNALTGEPRALCFITEGKCGRVYALANVLYHELAHCWNMLATATEARFLPAPMRAGGPLGKILLEGIAFHREWEVYVLYEKCIRLESWEYAALFDDLGVSRAEAVFEFELETRYWRLARFLRALFDARVHSGRQGYLDFLREQQAATGFAQERIHDFCFCFYSSPGYAPCYAMGGMKLAALQEESLRRGLSRREFNTRVNRMGLVPPTFWRRLLDLQLTGETLP